MRRRRAAALLLAFLASGGLASGCGFRLRRWNFGTAFEGVRINADRSVDLDGELARTLAAAGAPTANDDANVVLTLTNQSDSRRSVAATRSGRAAEYELSMQIEFAVADASGKILAPPRILRSARTVRLDRDNIVGSSEEQALVQREIRTDLVDRMMRALGALARAHDTAVVAATKQ